MVQAILGKQYTITTCLEKHGRDWTFKATDPQGYPYRVKFIADPDRFFDELALYYAADEQTCLSPLVYNYPAYMVSDDPFIFDDDLVCLLEFEEEKPFSTEAQRHASSLSRMGALVFADSEAPPLTKYLETASESDAKRLILKLLNALKNLHESGEAHGAINAANVTYDPACDKLYLAGLQLDSHQADDVYQVAHEFLCHLVTPGTRPQRMVERCLKENPADRPTITDILQVLAPQKRVQPLLASIAAILLLGFALWLFPKEPTSILDDMNRLVPVSEKALFPQTRTQLQRARLIQSASAPSANIQDFEIPIAILDDFKNPVLIGRQRNYRLGDQLTFPHMQAQLVVLNQRQAIFEQAGKLLRFSFPATVYQDGLRSKPETTWFIWPQPNNVEDLLLGLARMETISHPLLEAVDKGMPVTATSVYGVYPAKDPYALLASLETQLNVDPVHGIQLRDPATALHLILRNQRVKDATVGGFAEFLESRLGIEVTVPDHLRERKLDDHYFEQDQWQNILNALDLQWQVSNNIVQIEGISEAVN